MKLRWLLPASLLVLVPVAVLLLSSGCDTAPEGDTAEEETANEAEVDATPQRYEVESEEDARIVLDEPLFDDVDAWSGFYHATQQEDRRVADGAFQVISEHSAPDFPDAPITTTYEGQFSDGVRHGEFSAYVESPEGETLYRLLFDEDGSCAVGYIDQQAEGIAVEKEVSSPRPCTFATLRDTLYAQ